MAEVMWDVMWVIADVLTGGFSVEGLDRLSVMWEVMWEVVWETLWEILWEAVWVLPEFRTG